MDDDDWLFPDAQYQNQGGPTDPLVEQEYQLLSSRYTDAGYREGITDGKLKTLQQGFDQGFANSVPASRRLGQLRGRANAVLAWMLRVSTFPSEEVESVREVIRDLGRVRRGDVIPRDHERETHEREEHGGEEAGFELGRIERRELERLETRFERLGGVSGVGERDVGEGERVDTLERRLRGLEEKIRSGR